MNKNDNIKELPKVTVKNHTQLIEALKPFMIDTTIRKLFIEGMNVIKRQSQFTAEYSKINEEDFGGYFPAQPARGQHYAWVDTFVDRRLDAKRDGLKIVWNIAEGRFEFDPWTKDLRQVSGKSETNS